MPTVRVGVVTTFCEGREQNVSRLVNCLEGLDPAPEYAVLVADGCNHIPLSVSIPTTQTAIRKHEPGDEQPRNVGVRMLMKKAPELTHVLFLDSDMIFKSDLLKNFLEIYDAEVVRTLTGNELTESHLPGSTGRILLGPYDWLPQGQNEINDQLRNDVRWVSFDRNDPHVAYVGHVGAALGCFGGNMLWPLDVFCHLGGFHPDLHAGRCEDGELGLRAAAACVPMSFVRKARAWHVWHPINHQLISERNERDVPLLNSWHPSVEKGGFVLTEADGARFDWRCPDCGTVMNSHDVWGHLGQHETGEPFTYLDPASVKEPS